jgi:hypothetical protein
VIEFVLFTRQCYLTLLGAGRVCRAFPPPVPETARHGYYWFLYLPRLRWNGGRFGSHECVSVTLQWLRWSLDFTAYQPNSARRRR